jgi:hypothetical protein
MGALGGGGGSAAEFKFMVVPMDCLSKAVSSDYRASGATSNGAVGQWRSALELILHLSQEILKRMIEFCGVLLIVRTGLKLK